LPDHRFYIIDWLVAIAFKHISHHTVAQCVNFVNALSMLIAKLIIDNNWG
jgi:hypothetical protein